MSRTCRDCEALESGCSSLEDPHEYLVMTGRSATNGAAFYRCLLCNTFLTLLREGSRRWNPGFLPQDPTGAAKQTAS